MHDIRLIRDDPAAFEEGLDKRGFPATAEQLIEMDRKIRSAKTALQEAQAKKKVASGQYGQLRAQGQGHTTEAMDLQSHSIEASQEISAIESELPALEAILQNALASIPNIPYRDVPAGIDEQDNVVVKTWGEPAKLDFPAKEHDELGKALGMDFDAAGTVSGARFVYLKGGLARLNRALGQFMLDMQTGTHGYTEVVPPVLVRDAAMFGTGQLPKFAEDLFQTTDGRWLIPTAEVSLTNYVRGQILAETELPIRFTALTNCFRAEAGAAGRDTRGIIRQHQFEKVELVSIVAPEQSEDEHERMTRAAESVLEALALPYRRMLLCTGDMGFTAKRTFDLEVWLPGQQRYREISSCSTCGDFQARRMNARYRPAGETKGTRFVHTLNGSGLAVGRTLVAIMENYQTADGAVRVPDALRPYMNGIEAIEPA
jgi:seryl-tRNA synthetase